jgi:hypothetical protein
MQRQQRQQQQVEWRRAKVLELMSKGETSQAEIARILQVDRSTICRDVDYLRQQAKENITRYVDERLPEEYEKCLVGLNSILREAWNLSQQANDSRTEKIKALTLAKECYVMKLDLLTNAMVIDDAMRFVSSNAVATRTEKDHADYSVTRDRDEESGVQRSEESRVRRQPITTEIVTNNTVF